MCVSGKKKKTKKKCNFKESQTQKIYKTGKLQQLEAFLWMAASQAWAEINLRWKSVVRGSPPHCVWERRVCSLCRLRGSKEGATGICFFILTFLNRYIWLGGSSPVSTCASGCKWISVLVPGALLHSPGAAKTSWSLDTAAVPFQCRAKMSRFKSDLFGCSRLHDYMAVIDGMKRWRRRWEAREADFFRFHSSPTECRGA